MNANKIRETRGATLKTPVDRYRRSTLATRHFESACFCWNLRRAVLAICVYLRLSAAILNFRLSAADSGF
jgi:hypothetical protein